MNEQNKQDLEKTMQLLIDKKHVGTDVLKFPYPNHDWFNRVEFIHQNIRSVIGGTSKTFEFNVKNESEKLPLDECASFYNTLHKYLDDNYWNRYSFGYEILCEEKVEVRQKTDFGNPAKFRKIKLTSHINEYMRLNKYSTQRKLEVNNILALLGNRLDKLKTEQDTIYSTISTAPHDFLRLGHYGPDSSIGTTTKSCYGHSRERASNKIYLAQSENTFVIYMSRSKIDDIVIDDGRIIARMYGVLSENNCVLNICNVYIKDKQPEGNIQKIIKLTACGVLNIDIKNLRIKEKDFKINNIYQNIGRDGEVHYKVNWSLHDINNKNLFCNNVFTMNVTPYVCIKFCKVCKSITDQENCVCKKCYESLPECSLTKLRIMSDEGFLGRIKGVLYTFHKNARNMFVTIDMELHHKDEGIINEQSTYSLRSKITICQSCEEIGLTERESITQKMCVNCRDLKGQAEKFIKYYDTFKESTVPFRNFNCMSFKVMVP